MKITEENAIDIAIEFAKQEYESSEFSLDYETASARLVKNSPTLSFLNTKGEYWSVLMTIKHRNGDAICMDPNHVIIVVDANNGKAEWYPVL